MLINYRDFGGMATAYGRHVQSDRLFRSGHFGLLDPHAAERIIGTDFATIIDLRYAEERERDRSPWPEHMLDRVVTIDRARTGEAPHQNILAAARSGMAELGAAYSAFYAALPYDQWYRPLFARALSRIAATPGRVLIHCSAGKDRTGTLAALLLDLLGVERSAISADYLRSDGDPGLAGLRDQMLANMTNPDMIGPAAAAALVGVKPAYLAAAFDAIERRSGSVESYFREGGVATVDLAALRSNYLVR